MCGEFTQSLPSESMASSFQKMIESALIQISETQMEYRGTQAEIQRAKNQDFAKVVEEVLVEHFGSKPEIYQAVSNIKKTRTAKLD